MIVGEQRVMCDRVIAIFGDVRKGAKLTIDTSPRGIVPTYLVRI
jgi:hypothetical protein